MDNVGMMYVVKKATIEEGTIQTNLSILYILEGSMTVEYYDEKYLMQKNDILLVSPGIQFAITECDSAIYGMACFGANIIASITGTRNMIFHLNSMTDVDKSFDELREIFFCLTKEYAAQEHKTGAYTDSLLLKMIDILVEEFQVSSITPGKASSESDSRMKDVMQYIIANLDREISLNELAEKMFISPSTLSRIFKKNTGQYFADFVMEMRLKNAMSLLSHSKQNVTQIALTCGFTNSASFNRAFKKQVGTTPMEYRRSHCDNHEEDKASDVNEAIKRELVEKGYTSEQAKRTENVFVDLKKGLDAEYKKQWQEIINIGAISLLSAANMQYHALYLYKQLHFKYYRVWNIFDKRLMITDGTQMGGYNYDLIDQILDFMVTNHLKPFLDFGRRPSTAFSTYGSSVYMLQECVDFKSKAIWKHAINDFINHLVAQYGIDEVSGWRFELSRNVFHDNDVADNRLYEDKSYSFFEAFEIFYNIIKTKLPKAKVGGIGGIVTVDRSYLSTFYEKCVSAGISLDFVSIILFPYTKGSEANPKADVGLYGNEDYDINIINDVHKILSDAKISADTKVVITEWNNSLSNRNFLNDSPFRAAFIASKMVKLLGKADAVGIMGGSDWISNYMDSVGILNGAVGLLSKDTIKKPAYYALDFLNQLGDRLLLRGENYIVTQKESGGIYIITFNQTWIKNSYLYSTEAVRLKMSNENIFTNDKPLTIKLHIQGLDADKVYCIKKRTLNNTHGNALNEWKKFQFDTRLTRPDVKYIEAISIPDLTQEKHKITKENTSLDIEVTMDVHEIDLIHIFKTE